MKEIFPKVEHGIVHRVPHTVFKYNGWPSITKDERGVLYCTASSMRIQHVDPAGKNCMFVSLNEGKTWTPPIVVNDSYLDDRDTGIAYLGNGKLCMSWFSSHVEDNYAFAETNEGWCPMDKGMIMGMGAVVPLVEDTVEPGCFVKLSDDYGISWSENIKVPMNCPHGPAVLKDGTMIFFSKIWGGECGENADKIAAFHSADDGRTWTLRGTVPVPSDITLGKMHEPHMVELPSGRLLGAIRVHDRAEAPVFTVYTTFSDDGGFTWSEPVCIGVDGSPPHLLVHSSGAVICSYSRRGAPGNKSERACVSYDGGETWAEDYVIHPDVPFCDHGYPATVELSDGSLLTVYYQAWDKDNFCSVLQTKWRLEDK